MKCLSQQWGNIAQLMEAVILSKKIVENSTLGGGGSERVIFHFFFKKKIIISCLDHVFALYILSI